MDMVWDDPNTLLTCGYDTCIRKWDLRYYSMHSSIPRQNVLNALK